MATTRGIAKPAQTQAQRAPVHPLLSQLRNPALIQQVSMALPMNLKNNAEKYMRQLTTLVQLNPKLMECEPSTVFGALMNAAALGLELSPALQQCYIIPRWNSKAGCQQAQFQMGYRGMLALAYQSPKIKSIAAKEICDGDDFECEFGPGGFLKHRPSIRGRRGVPFAYYAYAVLDSGQLIFDVMSREDMESFAQSNSDAFKSGPWRDHFDEMAKKTMLKKIWKLLPLATEARVAEAADEGVKKVDVSKSNTAETIMDMPSEYIDPAASSEPSCVASEPESPSEDFGAGVSALDQSDISDAVPMREVGK